MGIRMLVFSVSASDLERIVAKPDLVRHLLDCEPGSRAAPDLPRALCGLDRSFDLIHFALTGKWMESDDRVLGFLSNGDQLGIELGYGPPHALTPEAVARVHAALAARPPADLAAQLDCAQAMELGDYDAETTEEDLREYLAECCGALRDFVAEAVTTNQGLVVTLV
jgi:hypothetical protein